VPAANSAMIQDLDQADDGDRRLRLCDRINGLVNAFGGEAQRSFISTGAYFSGLEYAMTAMHLVVVGPLNHPKTHELSNAILAAPCPTASSPSWRRRIPSPPATRCTARRCRTASPPPMSAIAATARRDHQSGDAVADAAAAAATPAAGKPGRSKIPEREVAERSNSIVIPGLVPGTHTPDCGMGFHGSPGLLTSV